MESFVPKFGEKRTVGGFHVFLIAPGDKTDIEKLIESFGIGKKLRIIILVIFHDKVGTEETHRGEKFRILEYGALALEAAH